MSIYKITRTPAVFRMDNLSKNFIGLGISPLRIMFSISTHP